MIKLTPQSKKVLVKFGLSLRNLREQKRWTLEEAEERGFKSWRYLQRLESGKHNISLLTIVEIAKLYNKRPSELLKDL